MLHTFRKFLHHYASATLIDVLHSPFVFELFNTCLARQQYQSPELNRIDKEWGKVCSNNTLLEQIDFGAEGHTNLLKKKPVSFYAKKHASSKRKARIIHHIISHYQYQNCIELGTSLGYTSMHIGAALPEGSRFTTIEGAPEIAAQAQIHFKNTGLTDRIQSLTGNFDDLLPSVLKEYNAIDFAFIDGNHAYDATLRYFEMMLPKKHNNTILVFDDIYWNKEMTKAWEEIKAHAAVTVTVDLFFIGLVFFRREQRKQHFKLRLF